MEETYFTRKAEEIYGPQAVEWTRAYFDSETVTEAFFAVSAQIDMLVEEHEVNVWDAEFRNIEDEKWTPEKILDAADEIATIAHQQKSGVWPMIASFAACMRAMYRTAPICPSGSFVAKKDQKIPPGMVALLEREDLKPADLLVATIVEDLGAGTATAAAVSAERETCIALVQTQIDKVVGEGERKDLDSEEDWACDLLEQARDSIAARRPPEPEADDEEPAQAPEKTDAGS